MTDSTGALFYFANCAWLFLANMAETVQIVASVAQIVDLTIKIVKRLHEYSEAIHGLPESLKHTTARLQTLGLALENTREAFANIQEQQTKMFQ